MQHLRTVRDKHVALTGCCWLPRVKLVRSIRLAGGYVSPSAEVTKSTDVLVRGYSPHWAYGDFGLKEAAAAKLIREGRRLLIIHDYEFQRLLEKGRPARCSDYIAGHPIAFLVPPPPKTAFERVASIRGPLDREQTVLGRIEQAFLRSQLFQGQDLARCSLCGHDFPKEIMVAAHVKPRSECTARERRDAKCIVFAVCLLGCDALYERGFLSVDEAGRVVTASAVGLPAAVKEHLRAVRGIRCPAWHEGTVDYFAWHYKRRFRGRGLGTVIPRNDC